MAGFPVGMTSTFPSLMTNTLPATVGTALATAARTPIHVPAFPGWGAATNAIPSLASRALGAVGMAFSPTTAGDATLEGLGYNIPTLPHSTRLAGAIQQMAEHMKMPPTAGGSNSMNTLTQSTWGWPGTDPDNLDGSPSPYAVDSGQSSSISPEAYMRLANGQDTLETLAGYPQNVLPTQQAVQPTFQPTDHAAVAMPDYVPQNIPSVQAGITDPTDWSAKLGTLSALTGGLAAPSMPQFDTSRMNSMVAQANRIKPQPQAQRQTTPAGQSSAGRGYTAQPGMSMQPTNVPGQMQLNLVQNQLRFNDPEYQRLYALRDAQVRQALQTRGIPYEEAMAASRMGVPLNL